MAQPVVNVTQGWLRGRRVSSIIGETFISFKGIPYAAPPTGDLRFKDPQPAEPWTGFRDAFEEGPVCAQKDWMTQDFRGKDDCLYLNIATKSLKGSRPVMVWVHGGGFASGSSSSDMHGPDYLLKADIVFVSFNYRLSILGFLNLDHEVAPGNVGLKDQVAALRWVKENISQFGGDPNNVTIFGESAGGESVNYLLLSPLTKGLFRRAITQSGAAMNSWVYPSKSVELAHELVALLGKDTKDPVEIIDHLRTIPVLELVAAAEELRASKDKLNGAALFLPSIDAKSSQPFLPRSVYELTAEGFDVPAIVGYNSHEGLLFGRALSDEFYSQVDEDFSIILPRNLKDLAPEKISELRELYFGDKPINGEVVDELVQCLGHLHFVQGVHRLMNGQLHKKSPTYLYKFSYDSPYGSSKSNFKSDIKGCSHGDDLRYIFYAKAFGSSDTLPSDPVEQTLLDRFIKMWTDFAATGNPTPRVDDDLITAKWEAITSTTKNYLAIDDTLNMGSNPDEEIIEKLIQILDFPTETD